MQGWCELSRKELLLPRVPISPPALRAAPVVALHRVFSAEIASSGVLVGGREEKSRGQVRLG